MTKINETMKNYERCRLVKMDRKEKTVISKITSGNRQRVEYNECTDRIIDSLVRAKEQFAEFVTPNLTCLRR